MEGAESVLFQNILVFEIWLNLFSLPLRDHFFIHSASITLIIETIVFLKMYYQETNPHTSLSLLYLFYYLSHISHLEIYLNCEPG